MNFQACLIAILFTGCTAQITLTVSNHTALLDSNAEIPCRYMTNGGEDSVTLIWSVVTPGGSQNLCKYVPATSKVTTYSEVVGDRAFDCSDTDGSLLISNVTFDDNDIFGQLKCEVDMVGVESKSKEISFRVVSLADAAPQTSLEDTTFSLSSGPDDRANVGTCTTGYAKPTPEIRFFRGDMSLDNAGNNPLDYFTSDETTDVNDNGEVNARRTLILALTKEDDDANFYCVVTSGFGESAETNLVQNVSFPKFRVRYPTDQVTIIPPRHNVFAGDELTLTCQANGYPEPTIMFSNTRLDANEATNTFDVTRNTEEVECSARNSEADASMTTTYTIEPLYADEPMISGETTVNYGDPLSLQCSNTSNPVAQSKKWMKGEEVASETGTLYFAEAMFGNSGMYKCVVDNEFDRLDQEKEAPTVVVNGLMLEGSDEENVAGEEQNTVDLECSVKSNSRPTFTWMKVMGDEEKELESVEVKSGDDYTYTSVQRIGPLDSTNSMETYKCVASNGVNPDVMKTFMLPEIEPQKSSPTAAIIIVILVVVLLVAVIVAVLYNKGIICKGSKKGDEEAGDITVKVPTEEPAGDAEAGKPADEGPAEDTRLMNGSENQ